MSGERLDVSQASASRQQGSNRHRSPSPYHYLELWDTDQPLISFEESEGGASLTSSSYHTKPTKAYSPTPRSLLDDYDELPRSRNDPVEETGLVQSHAYAPSSAPGSAAGSNYCIQCEDHNLTLYYCNLCDVTYCGKCWDKIGPHRKGKRGPGGIPHEKTDQTVADKLRAAFEASPDDQEQEAMFQADENTAWFGVVKDESSDLIFHDYGRYADIIAEISKTRGLRHNNRFPGLVCFVGETGAGKSSLIKVLIELSEAESDTHHQTPVVGSIRHQDVPTSGDVHLYTDPKTYLSDNPILYADCEGLAGGEREPKGARSRLIKHMNGESRTNQRTKSFQRSQRNLQHSSEREITWATTSERQTREFAVTQLYPRLLYTFSDVVVFALKNPRVIENVIEKLIEWAAAALEMSSNQPVLPHAVIALNASELSINPEQWEVPRATKWLMDAVKESISKNVKFRKHAQIWRSRGRRIDTVEDLLLSYYSSIRVVRIPGVGRPTLMKNQMEKLYGEISASLEVSKTSKRSLRMLLDADELQPYLQFAFDHFSTNLDRAFDFVQASFISNPIPPDFAGNILKLAVNMMEIWENKLDGVGIFVELSLMVASCIMLDSARKKNLGAAELIWPEYVEHCDNVLEDFCDRYWPCEYVMKGKLKDKAVGGRCVNVRSGHGSKGHQFKNGKVFAVGPYESSFSVESFQEEWSWLVYESLKKLLDELRENTTESELEDKVAAEIHRTKVMRYFYDHVTQGQNASLVSHSTCFSCLMRSPEHALPCGHILCTPCVMAYGASTHERDVVEINACPLHFYGEFRSWKIFLKPESAGVRVLTLDGGGVRGIVELEILKLIEQVWGGGLRIQDFFDLIVGTRLDRELLELYGTSLLIPTCSTGGIIALGLGSRNWSVDECISYFQNLCVQAFTPRIGINIPGMSMFIESIYQSRYETRPFQEALQEAFSEEDYLFGGPRASNSRIKVAVTATSSGTTSILANYNRARATSAAPRIFKPFSHGPSKQVYVDGALYHNNPIQVADLERKLLWPTDGYNYPDFVLSIGTAYCQASRKKLIEKSSMVNIGLFNHAKGLATIAMDHIKSSLDSEKTWTDYIQQLSLPQMYKDRYQRLNPELFEDPPALDDVNCMNNLRAKTRKYMIGDTGLNRVAHRLLATSFYFEKLGPLDNLSDGSVRCTGVIRCRLPRHALLEFGNFLNSSHERSQGPYFIVRERDNPQQAEQLPIDKKLISDLMIKLKWRMPCIHFKLSSTLAVMEIVLCIRKNEELHISGFPRRLQQENLRSNSKVYRWRNRTASQNKRRKKRALPVPHNKFHRVNSLSSYSTSDYLVGRSTPNHLRDISNKLGNDLEPLPAELSATGGMIYEMPDSSVPAELWGGPPGTQPHIGTLLNVKNSDAEWCGGKCASSNGPSSPLPIAGAIGGASNAQLRDWSIRQNSARFSFD
ncbi:Phospholipase A I [Lachnellula arida]|uniref:Phospholipase A I n=1 Tax=Lachnellula arida TaxID=1316785 RepID=A0A8T9B921_9HELO|nr:Phospholipase A I [Lachnellula arida]